MAGVIVGVTVFVFVLQQSQFQNIIALKIKHPPPIKDAIVIAHAVSIIII
jgi:hypothetical protein